jgi:hypothetical protein
MAQGIECLPSKCEALSSNPSTEKKNQNKTAKLKKERKKERKDWRHGSSGRVPA